MHYRAYDRALAILDGESWDILKRKAVEQFSNERIGQRKQGLFAQLNEAFAYRYLLNIGHERVRFLEEGKQKTPDIEFVSHGRPSYCEVKTIGVSDDEINFRTGLPPRTSRDYAKLSEGFLNKLSVDYAEAWQQIHAVGDNGLVFVLVEFDDIVLDHYRGYRKQITAFCEEGHFNDLIIKIGHIGGNHNLTRIRFVKPLLGKNRGWSGPFQVPS
jgi:hypothetical protein